MSLDVMVFSSWLLRLKTRSHARIQRGGSPLRFVRDGVLYGYLMGRRGGPKIVFILLLSFF